MYYTGDHFQFSCHLRKIKHTTRASEVQSYCKTSPSIFHSTSVRFNKSVWRVQYSQEIKCFFSSSASASLRLLAYQSTAHLVCVRPLMDFPWQEFGPRQEHKALTNLTTISLRQGGVEGLSVSCNWCVVHWAISPGSGTDVSTLTSVSLLSLCPDEPIIMRSRECCAFWEVAHKRMIRQSFQTEVVHTGRLFVEQNGNIATRGALVERPYGDTSTHTLHYVPYYLCGPVS